jgi:cytochrome c peroxidase
MLNQGLTFTYMFWDGRLTEGGFGPEGDADLPVFPPGIAANVLVRQAMLPVLNRGEMRGERGDRDVSGNINELAEHPDSAASAIWAAVMRRLLAFNDYVAKFNSAFPGVPASSLGFRHAASAIAAFELEAFTKTNSAFDRFLARDTRAMSDEAKRGGLLFFGRAQCASCHSGPLLGGQQFANIGVPQFGPGVGTAAPLDVGRGEIFRAFGGPDSPYMFAFRVPQLRNVELTSPYMHNGAYATLETVVRHYTNADSALRNYDVSQIDPALRPTHRGDATTIAKILRTLDFRVQQKISLNTTEQREIVAFLKSLTDPAARNLGAIAPAQVPSGLTVRD